MKDLGVISRKSKISLGILTKDASGGPLNIDFPVVAKVSKISADGVTDVDSVTLKTLNNGIFHNEEYALPESLENGAYEITYTVSINGEIFYQKESFAVEEIAPIADTNDQEDGKDYADKPEYILPPDFQLPAEISVEGNTVRIVPSSDMKPNHNYRIIVTKDVRSTDQQYVEDNYEMHFTSKYSPLYATPLEVRSILKDVFHYYELKDIYEAIRDAGQKAHQMLRMTASASQTGFELIAENEDAFFPAMKYSAYQAANQLLSQLIIRLMYSRDEDGTVIRDSADSSYSLGDFQVSNKSSQSEATSNGEPPETAVIKRLIEANERELKFWTDALMGRNARGYTSPLAVTSRGGVTAPESRDI